MGDSAPTWPMDSTSRRLRGSWSVMGARMKRCFRCGHPAFATLKVEAMVDNQRLKLAGDARDNAICSPCMIELAEWV